MVLLDKETEERVGPCRGHDEGAGPERGERAREREHNQENRWAHPVRVPFLDGLLSTGDEPATMLQGTRILPRRVFSGRGVAVHRTAPAVVAEKGNVSEFRTLGMWLASVPPRRHKHPAPGRCGARRTR
jgi:hypothetical protein